MCNDDSCPGSEDDGVIFFFSINPTVFLDETPCPPGCAGPNTQENGKPQENFRLGLIEVVESGQYKRRRRREG
jgi:hypothetical protein